jgi:hypothetical protein
MSALGLDAGRPCLALRLAHSIQRSLVWSQNLIGCDQAVPCRGDEPWAAGALDVVAPLGTSQRCRRSFAGAGAERFLLKHEIR